MATGIQDRSKRAVKRRAYSRTGNVAKARGSASYAQEGYERPSASIGATSYGQTGYEQPSVGVAGPSEGTCCSCGAGLAGPAGPPGEDGIPGIILTMNHSILFLIMVYE